MSKRYAHATSGDIDAFEFWLKDRGSGGSAFHYATATWLDERVSHRSSVHLVSEELLRSRRRAPIKVSKTDHTNRQLGCRIRSRCPNPWPPSTSPSGSSVRAALAALFLNRMSFCWPMCRPPANSEGESCPSTIIYQRNTAPPSSRVSKLLSMMYGVFSMHMFRELMRRRTRSWPSHSAKHWQR